MSGPWASAATPAAKVNHVEERLQRLSHTNGRRLPASRSLGPPHQARLPRSAPEFRPSLVAEAVVENLGLVRRPSHWPLQPAGDLPLQHRVGLEPDGVAEAFLLQPPQ